MIALIGMLLVGLFAGWIASLIMKAGKPGVLGMMLVGVLGSFVGHFLFAIVGFREIVFPASLIPAVVGAVVCIAVIRHLGRKF